MANKPGTGRKIRTIKPIEQMAADIEAEYTGRSLAAADRRKIYKAENAEFQREQLAGDLIAAVNTISEQKPVRVRFDDPDDVRQRIADYFTACGRIGRFPSIQGLAAFGFGISRQALNQWRIAPGHASTESGKLIEQAATMISDIITNQAMRGTANTIQAIFQLKNGHGFRDSYDISAEPAASLDDENGGPEYYRQRYGDLIEE